VFGFLVVGLIGAIIYGRSSMAGSGGRVRAMQLADEGLYVAIVGTLLVAITGFFGLSGQRGC